MTAKNLIRLIVICIASFSQFMTFAEQAKATTFTISEQQWSIPKNSESILEIRALRDAVKLLADNPNSLLLIKYPGGEDGVLWASELKGWLIALGLSSKRIELFSGTSKVNQIELQIKIDSN